MTELEATLDSGLLAAQVGWLRALALRLVRDEAKAQDLAQELSLIHI